MKRALLIAIGIAAFVWVGRASQLEASELRVATVQGANIRTFTGVPGGKYSFQCPNDGGSGQKVWYRPGCKLRTDAGVSCVVDAGGGDPIVDFSSSPDPYKVDLAANEDRIHFANADGYANVIHCNIYRRNP